MEAIEQTEAARRQEMYDALLTEDTATALDEMDTAARAFGAAIAEIYTGLERKSERKLARRLTHKMLEAILQTAWAEIIPPSDDEDES